jgi:SAM-dependent methyltransferase
MSNSAESPTFTPDPTTTRSRGTSSSLRLQCPICRKTFVTSGKFREPTCSGCGFAMSEDNEILCALTPDRELYFRQFIREYEMVRAKEGRGSSSAAYYEALPFRDLTGRNVWQWKIRARTFRHIEKCILPEIEDTHPHGCDILDVGAGNCWLSYRLALRGHRPVAVDLLTNEADGLGSAQHYVRQLPRTFPRFQAEMDHLPFASGQFDVVLFNASFHYSIDYERTLSEALRCLRRPGNVIIADSPFYWRDESGRTMLEERQRGFQQRFGFRSDSIESREYLTPQVLDALADKLSLQWRVLKPWYGIGWALRPFKARLFRRREPAKFYLLWAKVTDR